MEQVAVSAGHTFPVQLARIDADGLQSVDGSGNLLWESVTSAAIISRSGDGWTVQESGGTWTVTSDTGWANITVSSGGFADVTLHVPCPGVVVKSGKGSTLPVLSVHPQLGEQI